MRSEGQQRYRNILNSAPATEEWMEYGGALCTVSRGLLLESDPCLAFLYLPFCPSRPFNTLRARFPVRSLCLTYLRLNTLTQRGMGEEQNHLVMIDSIFSGGKLRKSTDLKILRAFEGGKDFH